MKYYNEKSIEELFASECVMVFDNDMKIIEGIPVERVRELFPGVDLASKIPGQGKGGLFRIGVRTRPDMMIGDTGKAVSLFTLAGLKLAAAWHNLRQIEGETLTKPGQNLYTFLPVERSRKYLEAARKLDK